MNTLKLIGAALLDVIGLACIIFFAGTLLALLVRLALEAWTYVLAPL